MDLVIVGIKYNKWKNTVWKGQIIPIEIDRSEAHGYQGRYTVKIYGKILGLFPKNQEKLPIGTKIFAILHTYQNHVKATLVDKPINWIFPFSEGSQDCFSSEFLSKFDDMILGIDFYRFQEESSPIKFHEWLLRMGLDENSVDEKVVGQYLCFQAWLADQAQSFEDKYDDEEVEKYKEYCRQEKELLEAEQSLMIWEFQQEEIRRNYGENASMDEYGVIFNDDGEYIGMYY
ncbi:hypothetical protein [Nostoc sp. LPT]|uniref:hypothetical protein n=1 Tax=Nostoc sp. LPT TaxID=2815387 RepID=UPI001DA42BAE|nr:hypothetical protein [Nostoc sp. LPT]MBN4002057.1 hypothetical protein [Nostoc sp. LPT]